MHQATSTLAHWISSSSPPPSSSFLLFYKQWLLEVCGARQVLGADACVRLPSITTPMSNTSNRVQHSFYVSSRHDQDMTKEDRIIEPADARRARQTGPAGRPAPPCWRPWRPAGARTAPAAPPPPPRRPCRAVVVRGCVLVVFATGPGLQPWDDNSATAGLINEG